MRGKIVNDPEFGEIVLGKSGRCRRISIRLRPGGNIRISLPAYLPYSAGLSFLDAKREDIRKIRERQAAVGNSGPKLSEQEILELRRLAKEWLPARLEMLATKYGFNYGRVAIKNNRTNWGSCSARNNINLNLHLMRLPQHLRDYVILHELCHLRHHNHGEKFHILLEELCMRHFGGDGRSGTDAGKDGSYPLTKMFEKEIRQYRTF
ncbi:MAG: M48 family metallopeptidase [Candidatus Cryptobacteroides sp.]